MFIYIYLNTIEVNLIKQLSNVTKTSL